VARCRRNKVRSERSRTGPGISAFREQFDVSVLVNERQELLVSDGKLFLDGIERRLLTLSPNCCVKVGCSIPCVTDGGHIRFRSSHARVVPPQHHPLPFVQVCKNVADILVAVVKREGCCLLCRSEKFNGRVDSCVPVDGSSQQFSFGLRSRHRRKLTSGCCDLSRITVDSAVPQSRRRAWESTSLWRNGSQLVRLSGEELRVGASSWVSAEHARSDVAEGVS
jgi:hypothetical protein